MNYSFGSPVDARFQNTLVGFADNPGRVGIPSDVPRPGTLSVYFLQVAVCQNLLGFIRKQLMQITLVFELFHNPHNENLIVEYEKPCVLAFWHGLQAVFCRSILPTFGPTRVF